MKNKILIFIIVFVAFISGGGMMYLFVGDPFTTTNNSSNASTNYNSCSNCMSGTMVVNNGGITQSVNKVYDAVVMVKNYQKNTLAGSGSGFI